MSNYIVLVKQVPDVTQITENAFNPETGTLVRSRLASVINELDTHALAFARQMRQLAGHDGKIVCLTMGQAMAQQVLRYCLSRCADSAVLLTDKALGGADTVATANPLAFAVRKIVKDIFAGDKDYYILAGMQSVDGDTAQVPAQLAEELDIGCIAYATDVEYKTGATKSNKKRLGNPGRFEFRRIISGGSQVVSAKKTPAVITVAKYEYPLFATFARARWADTEQIIQFSADDVRATNIGIAGSKTRVIQVFAPGKSTRKSQELTSVESLADVIADNLNGESNGREAKQDSAETERPQYVLPKDRADSLDRSYEGTAKEVEDFQILTGKLRERDITNIDQIDDGTKQQILAELKGRFHERTLDDMLAGFKTQQPSYSGDVWVIVEQDKKVIHPATFELLGKARRLADCLQVNAAAVLATGTGSKSMTRQLIAAGADEVYLVEHNLLAGQDVGPARKAVAEVIEKYKPQIVLFAATPWGRVLAPMVSYRLGCGLTADCTGLDIRDSSRRQKIAILMQTRPALGGNIMARICTKDSACQMATARPGVMEPIEPDTNRKGRVIPHTVTLSQRDATIKIVRTEYSKADADLTAADIIVSGGVGMQSRDNYEQLLGSLSETISNRFKVTVERAASRAAVEHGFADRIRQVGQTGTAVGPKIYLALGISGAIQHMIGIAKSRTIIAVNKDPSAPIFRQCDYYITASTEEIIPRLVEILEQSNERV